MVYDGLLCTTCRLPILENLQTRTKSEVGRKMCKNRKKWVENVTISLFQTNKCEKHTLFQGKTYKSLKYLKPNFKIAKHKDRK